MCDDLLAHHHRISSGSSIPLSSAPTWFSTQNYRDRGENRTYLFLPPSFSIDTHAKTITGTSPGAIKPTNFNFFPAFFEINPKWSIFAFDDSVLSLYPKADRVETLCELVNAFPPPHHIQALWQEQQNITLQMAGLPEFGQNYDVIEDTAWFKKTYPQKAACLSEEKILSVIDIAHSKHTGEEPKRAGYILLLPPSPGNHRLYISEIFINPEYHGKGIQHFSIGKNIARLMLSSVIDVASDIINVGGGGNTIDIWTTISLDQHEELLEVFFEMGWKLNRKMWMVEKNAIQGGDEMDRGEEKEEMKSGLGGYGPGESMDRTRTGAIGGGDHAQGWSLGDWGKGMKGWREQWVKALEDISHAKG